MVLIGHSQGTGMLTRLVKEEIDPNRAQRRRLVFALLIGGDVTVRKGRDRGGDFKHVRACRSARQSGCVIAYNSFLTSPAPSAFFGRAGGLFLPRPERRGARGAVHQPGRVAGRQRPAAPGAAGLRAWRRYTGLYSGRCISANGANWLQVTDVAGATDPRPRLTENLGVAWGLHNYDVNLALGNLVPLVERQARAYLKRSR